MKPLLKKLMLWFGVLSILFPLIMGILWIRYVREQDALYGAGNTQRMACEPFSMSVSHEQERLLIKWETKEMCAGFVLLGKTYSDFSNLPYKVLSAQGEAPSKQHEIMLLKQDELQYRYVIIVSNGEWYGINGNPFEYR